MTPAHRITPSKFQRKQKKHFKPRLDTNKQYSYEDNHKRYYKEDKQRRYNSHQAHTSQERCKKCGDSKHIKGFRCPVRKYQCKNCHKFGHFSSLCNKKIGYEDRRSLESRSPKAPQLKIGSVCAQDSICGQSEDFSSSDESSCL